MLELIAAQDLAQITISDVTKRADVNRSTFYDHYTDVHDLAAAACTTMFDELISASPVLLPEDSPADYRRGREALTGVLAHIGQRARLYRALLGDDGSARVINHLHQRLTVAVHVNLTEPDLDTHAQDPSQIPDNPAAAVLAGSLLGLVLDWLRRGCPETPEQLIATVWPGTASRSVFPARHAGLRVRRDGHCE
ncbi:TetR/AcrR family transcriptional regulator [Frankia sp. AgB32]|uniref:TetR/AcrR family transcriptional regulator n=1 Tax=Frankia sp. AgB32 TaxID=631119 RepID=UPI00200F7189|nr:TetR/AcrR family transcriptional regulator [Frankia sp. AgB32]MCK9898455.1 TetR/AcrR family transcriptional regulator [Frankia sp. AgB32]